MTAKKRKFPILLTAIILISVIYGAVSLSQFISMRNQKMEIIAENNTRITTLQKDIDQMNSELKHAGSSAFIEKVAREDLGMVKPREVVYIDKSKEKNLPSDNN